MIWQVPSSTSAGGIAAAVRVVEVDVGVVGVEGGVGAPHNEARVVCDVEGWVVVDRAGVHASDCREDADSILDGCESVVVERLGEHAAAYDAVAGVVDGERVVVLTERVGAPDEADARRVGSVGDRVVILGARVCAAHIQTRTVIKVGVGKVIGRVRLHAATQQVHAVAVAEGCRAVVVRGGAVEATAIWYAGAVAPWVLYA
eukprot:4072006-Pleurochrysis_carterae.AAC.2